jgi:hypothetical protein
MLNSDQCTHGAAEITLRTTIDTVYPTSGKPRPGTPQPADYVAYSCPDCGRRGTDVRTSDGLPRWVVARLSAIDPLLAIQ